MKEVKTTMTDVTQVSTDMQGIGLFIKQINEVLPLFYDNGINLTLDSLIDVLEQPQTIRDIVNKIAEKDKKRQALASMRELIQTEANKLSNTLLEQVLKVKNIEGMPNHNLSIDLLRAVKSYMDLSGGILIISGNYKQVVEKLNKYTANETGVRMLEYLNDIHNKAIEYTRFCRDNNIEDSMFLRSNFLKSAEKTPYPHQQSIFERDIIKRFSR